MPASDDGGWLRYPKRTEQTPVRSLPRKENGKARAWMVEKSVRKSHGQHIPPAKGMGERALLLLGLLSLLTAADEVRHADAQHRATSDPGEGHAVKAGQREAGALLVLDGKSDSATIKGGVENEVRAILGCGHLQRIRALVLIKTRGSNGERKVGQRVVAVERVGLLDRVGAGIEALDIDLALIISRKRMSSTAKRAVLLDILGAGILVGTGRLDGELYARELNVGISRVLLDELERVGVVADGVGHGLTLGVVAGVVGVDELDCILIALATDNDILSLGGIKFGGVGHNDLGIRLDGCARTLKIIERDRQKVIAVLLVVGNSILVGSDLSPVDRNLNGSLFGSQAGRELVMELIVIRIECIDVLSDGTGQLVLNILAHLGVSLVSPIAFGLVVPDLLFDRGDVRLLGNLHSAAAHDGENRRGAGLLLLE